MWVIGGSKGQHVNLSRQKKRRNKTSWKVTIDNINSGKDDLDEKAG